MRRSELLQGVRLMRFEEIYNQYRSRRLSCETAAELLGSSVSTFYRMRGRYEEEGFDGLLDRRLGKRSSRRAPLDEVMKVVALFETQYYDFTVKHFHEKPAGHGIDRSYTWTKKVLQTAGVVKKAPRRGAHRRKRARRPLPGMMLHQDGSRHQWVPGQLWDLIVTMDDADNTIYSGFFVEEEGTMSSLVGLLDVIQDHGLFCSLYVDRGSHYFTTPKAGGKVDRNNPTQVGRALRQLGIELIPRLLPGGPGPADVLCVQEDRSVANDNTVSYKRRTLQIPADKHRLHYVKAKVRVHEYPDSTLAVFHGPGKLAHYNAEGQPKNTKTREKAA